MNLKTPQIQKEGQGGPTTLREAVEALKAAGFREEQDSPASGALRYDFPDPDPRFILVSNALGGWWPQEEADGISGGLYDPREKDEQVADVCGMDDAFRPRPASEVIPELLQTVQEWMDTANILPISTGANLRSAQTNTPELPKGWEVLAIAGLPLHGRESGWSWSIRSQIPGNVFEWRDLPGAWPASPAEALERRQAALTAFREAGFCTVDLGTHLPVHEQSILAFLPEELEMLGPTLAERFVTGWSHYTSASRDQNGQLTLYGLTGSDHAVRPPADDDPKVLEIRSNGRVFRYEWDQARFDEKAKTACNFVDGNAGGWVLQGMPDVLDALVHQMAQGRQVVLSDAQFDALVAPDAPWADGPWWNRFATMPNPNQVGTLDRWVGFFKPRSR